MWQRCQCDKLSSALFNSGVFSLSQLTFCSNWDKWRGADCFKSGTFTQVITESPDNQNNPACSLLCLCFIVFWFFPLLLPLILTLCNVPTTLPVHMVTKLKPPEDAEPHYSMAFQALVSYCRTREEKVSRNTFSSPFPVYLEVYNFLCYRLWPPWCLLVPAHGPSSYGGNPLQSWLKINHASFPRGYFFHVFGHRDREGMSCSCESWKCP